MGAAKGFVEQGGGEFVRDRPLAPETGIAQGDVV
jgi:hypothetical protein